MKRNLALLQYIPCAAPLPSTCEFDRIYSIYIVDMLQLGIMSSLAALSLRTRDACLRKPYLARDRNQN